jgi:Photosynthetic reaction centre cytochrome C subunit
LRLIQIIRIISLLTVATLAMARATAMQDAVRTVRTASAQTNPLATHLKVLPKDTSVQDLYKIMAGMQRDLGVQCGFCHEEDPDSKQINYASDENPRKEMARAMMRMTNDINTKYLGQLGDRQYAPPITCGNCHLGQMHPPPFDPAAR